MHRCIQCLQPIHETLTVFNFTDRVNSSVSPVKNNGRQ